MAYDVIIGVVAAAIIGFVFGFLFGRSRRSTAVDEVVGLKKELADYKDSVRKHFSETSDLVQALTHDYKKVYDHLAGGAVELCDDGDVPTPPRLHWESSSDDRDELQRTRKVPELSASAAVVADSSADTTASSEAEPYNSLADLLEETNDRPEPADVAAKLAEQATADGFPDHIDDELGLFGDDGDSAATNADSESSETSIAEPKQSA